MPLVAAFALHLFAVLRLQSLVPRAAVGVLLTPAVLSLGAITIANAAGLDDHDSFNRAESRCLLQDRELRGRWRGLPPGIVAADIDYGSFLLALTPHRCSPRPITGSPPASSRCTRRSRRRPSRRGASWRAIASTT